MVKESFAKKELCIVHIGMPKTGSSALQESLSTNIKDKNIAYSNRHVVNHSAIIFSLFASEPYIHSLHQINKSSELEIQTFNENNKKLLIKSFTDNTSNIEIISGEDIFHIDEAGLLKMKIFLTKYFHKILIVGYIRSPQSFMQSAFQQLVKNHNLNSFDFRLIYPHYKMKLEKFDRVFEKENVQLWKFDPSMFPKSDITLDFATRLNIDIDSQKIKRENESISQEAVGILFANNKYGNKFHFNHHNGTIHNILIEKISTIGSHKLKFSTTLMDEILNLYQEDINWIEKRMNISLRENYLTLQTDINSENDLLQFSDEIVNELKNLIREKNIPHPLSINSTYISNLVDILRLEIASTFKNNQLTQQEIQSEYEILQSFSLNWNNYFELNHLNNFLNEDPIMHYIYYWEIHNLIIDNRFDTFYYLNTYPDIKKANINPIIHYYRYGRKEGRKGIRAI